MPGGFLGVEVFFVISGYLITSLLLAEWRQRRPHRPAGLLAAARAPAAAGAVPADGVTLVFAVVFLPSEVAGLRGDALAALGYVTNWYLIFSHQSYFETMGRPSLLQHLWSLAVEEQFYIALAAPLQRRAVALAAAAVLVAVLAGSGGVDGADGAAVSAGRRPVARLLRHRHPGVPGCSSAPPSPSSGRRAGSRAGGAVRPLLLDVAGAQRPRRAVLRLPPA